MHSAQPGHSGVVTDRSGAQVARWLFTDRAGGFSAAPYKSLNVASHVGDAPLAVAANRSVLADRAGLPVDRLVFPGLTHSTRVGLVEEATGIFPDVDVLVTAKRKIGLVTLGADCVPLVAVNPLKRVALTAHIGWRGAADGIVDSIAAAFESLGASLAQTQVFLGPSICGICYQVDSERRSEVMNALPASGQRSATGVDLRDGLKAALAALGARVEFVGGCTAEDAALFSHRRDGVTGRQAAVVVLT